jgi:hypothetical protein
VLGDAIVVLGAAWVARVLFTLVIPPAALSADVDHWIAVAQALAANANPYQVTSHLNWPPIWMQMVYVMSAVSTALDVPFPHVLRFLLVAFESLLVVALLRLVKDMLPEANARRLLLWGIALNPIAILLVCQHGNFDVVVALCIVLFMGSLLRFQRGGDPVDWLLACCFLGLGVATKTIPLILSPLLACRFRGLPWKVRWLGGTLVLGPVILGLSVIYVLAPAEVTANVLAYRSSGGWFGVSGLLLMTGASSLLGTSGALFSLVLGVAVIYFAYFLGRRPETGDRALILLAALLLAAIPAFGPGYAPQYIYWFMPLLIVTFASFGKPWRWVLGGFALTAAMTYVVEYALFPSHGMFLTRMTGAEPFLTWSRTWSTQAGQTVIRLPLFIAFIALLGVGFHHVRRGLSAPGG